MRRPRRRSEAVAADDDGALGLPERIKRLAVTVGNRRAGELLRESRYGFWYGEVEANEAISLTMPTTQTEWADGDLFPVMDMNLPEGDLFQRIVERAGKFALTKMHLLALMRGNGVGRLGYWQLGEATPPPAPPVPRETLMRSAASKVFEQLVDAYLGQSIGVAGVQPKLMLPSRASIPVPDLIVKTAGADFPGLAANEYLCLSAAKAAGLQVPVFALNDDASMLLIDRFDLKDNSQRLGFEDIAALMGLRVHDRLSNRKYQGSYEDVAEVVRLMGGRHVKDNLARLYEQIVLSVMVRNGDAHLKNFGLLYDNPAHPWLSPLFDVVTTTIYRIERPGGFQDVDRTMALKLRRGKHGAGRAYPTTEELVAFGHECCGVREPMEVIHRIAEGMRDTLVAAASDQRICRELWALMREQWFIGVVHAGAPT
jgi:serine/threonine-protein kinase HipA